MHNSPWDSPTGIHRNPLRGYCNFTELTFSLEERNKVFSCSATLLLKYISKYFSFCLMFL